VLLRKLRGGKDFSYETYRASVLVITFIAYAFYHMSRKPPSIVKSVLDPEGSVISTLGSGHYALPAQWTPSYEPLFHNSSSSRTLFHAEATHAAGWAPFDGKTGKKRLGEIDVAFLASYAFGMYFAGHLGDRSDLRKFLSGGMLASGFFVCLFGMGRYWNIHRLDYYLIVQMFAGLFQATGWPTVVAIVGHWFGKKKRGLIMGIWNAHTSIGNIMGSLIAASVLKYGWDWSFIIPGSILALGGLLVFGFLVVDPHDVGLPSPQEIEAAQEGDEVNGAVSPRAVSAESESERTGLLADDNKNSSVESVKSGVAEESQVDLESQVVENKQDVPELSRNDPAVGFLEAWRIPGVATFALCLFFSKLVAYTFLYWLPFYIRQTPIDGKILDEKTAGQLSTLFDVGGVVGGIMAGHISDKMNARAITAAGFMYLAIPAMFLYRTYGSVSLPLNIVLMVTAGMLINGPYALITTAVSADLGTHSSLKGNGRALATVTAIIDGTGSLGAAIGPLLTGFLSGRGWSAVFIMLMVAALFAGLLLTKLVVHEVVEKLEKYQRLRNLTASAREELTDLLLGGGRK
jgi:OPA family glycerol-3-phosphate transporter-like MFS transporter 1/2